MRLLPICCESITRTRSPLVPADCDREIGYLLEYARDDWLGFSVISGAVAILLGKGATRQELTSVTLRVVGDLYDRGVRAGDLTASEVRPLSPWHADKQETLDRIELAMRKLPGMPDSGDICWFTVP